MRRVFGFRLWKTAARIESLVPASVLKSPRQKPGGLGDGAQSVQPAVARRVPFAHDVDSLLGEEEVDVAVRVRKPKAGALSAEEAARLSALMKDAKLERVPLGVVQPNPRNAKRHPRKQIDLLSESIRQLGFNVPIIVDEANVILAGHARYAAARKLGFSEVPIIRLTHLSAEEQRLFALADNKLPELGSWDFDQLKTEILELSDPPAGLSFDMAIDMAIAGFDTVEIDEILTPAPERRSGTASELAGASPVVTAPGDIWELDHHILHCNSPLESGSYEKILGADPVVAFVDPPFDELSSEQRLTLVKAAGEQIHSNLALGGVVYWFMAWPHLGGTLSALEPVFGAPREMAVWVKSGVREGTLYQSRHEHVAVYVKGLGVPQRQAVFARRRRHRTNVWEYPGGDHGGSRGSRSKPVAMIVDAIQDWSRRLDHVLDPFAGTGATLIAAQRMGRRARLIEQDPAACDAIVRRWQELTGGVARLAGGAETFAEVAKRRS